MTNLVIPQGSTCKIRIPNVRDANGNLITNFAGYSVKAHVRDRVESTTVLYEWTSQGGSPNVTFDAPASAVDLLVPGAVSSAWAFTRGRYDAELTNPSGEPGRIGKGHIIVDRETTR